MPLPGLGLSSSSDDESTSTAHRPVRPTRRWRDLALSDSDESDSHRPPSAPLMASVPGGGQAVDHTTHSGSSNKSPTDSEENMSDSVSPRRSSAPSAAAAEHPEVASAPSAVLSTSHYSNAIAEEVPPNPPSFHDTVHSDGSNCSGVEISCTSAARGHGAGVHDTDESSSPAKSASLVPVQRQARAATTGRTPTRVLPCQSTDPVDPPLSVAATTTRLQQLYKDHEKRRERHLVAASEAECRRRGRETAGCSFEPVISARAKSLRRKPLSYAATAKRHATEAASPMPSFAPQISAVSQHIAAKRSTARSAPRRLFEDAAKRDKKHSARAEAAAVARQTTLVGGPLRRSAAQIDATLRGLQQWDHAREESLKRLRETAAFGQEQRISRHCDPAAVVARLATPARGEEPHRHCEPHPQVSAVSAALANNARRRVLDILFQQVAMHDRVTTRSLAESRVPERVRDTVVHAFVDSRCGECVERAQFHDALSRYEQKYGPQLWLNQERPDPAHVEQRPQLSRGTVDILERRRSTRVSESTHERLYTTGISAARRRELWSARERATAQAAEMAHCTFDPRPGASKRSPSDIQPHSGVQERAARSPAKCEPHVDRAPEPVEAVAPTRRRDTPEDVALLLERSANAWLLATDPAAGGVVEPTPAPTPETSRGRVPCDVGPPTDLCLSVEVAKCRPRALKDRAAVAAHHCPAPHRKDLIAIGRRLAAQQAAATESLAQRLLL